MLGNFCIIFDMKQKKKPKLILIHSVGSNSDILEGLDKSLDRYFDNEIIDLPGFSPDVPPLEEITIENMVNYVENQLEKYKEEPILIGGISFGFAVINRVNFKRFNIKGVLAIEPYLGYKSLKLSEPVRKIILNLLNIIRLTKLEDELFREKILEIYYHLDHDLLAKIINDYDPKTFVESLILILTDEQTPKFFTKDQRYLILMNKEDNTIDIDFILKNFTDYNHKFIPISMKHYPDDLSSSYFDKHLPKMDLIRDYFDF